MNKLISALVILVNIYFAFQNNVQAQGANLNNNNVVGWNNVPTNLVKENISYNDVKGNCFWKNEWLPVKIFMNNGDVYKLPKAKLNLYASSIHYINNQGAEVAAQGGIRAVVFYSPADTTRAGVFKVLSGTAVEGREFFAQILVDGNIKFLKATLVRLVKQESDPLLKTIEWIFEPRDIYFVEEKGNTHELKSLNKKHLFSLIEKKDQDEGWLKQNKNSLRNEEEVKAFLSYRNTLIH
ncbi:MAG: hypothetical protein JST43_06825 [Bacteroidetes bacterium]|nr:hypothetical protein [Bacteroidota bacterium]MBS1539595.1 hypothetical protein [Bacteroidota bacterium]